MANLPGTHIMHLAAALVLPAGPPWPAMHGVPSQAERAPGAAAYVPLEHGIQPTLHRQGLDTSHPGIAMFHVLVAIVCKLNASAAPGRETEQPLGYLSASDWSAFPMFAGEGR
jgi:hypothetical protein